MGRVLVIGDIHGARRALDQLLLRAGVTSNDSLVFLGDYVDGWSESASVLGQLLTLQRRQQCIFIKGNHDVWCEEWLRSGATNPTWLGHGGLATIDSYKHFNQSERETQLQFLEQMPFYYIDSKNRLFIHAGFTNPQGPEQEFTQPGFTWDRTLWKAALGESPRLERSSPHYPQRLAAFEEIFIGHTPTLHYQKMEPMLAANVWNMDTGAGFHGKLSMMDVDSKEVWRSDLVPALYPGEPGRRLNTQFQVD